MVTKIAEESTSLEMTTSRTPPTMETSKRELASKPDSWLGVRHLQAILLFLGILTGYAQRVNLSVAIVAMVDKEGANPDYPEYDWDEATKGYILSSFFWGYVVMQIPGSQLSQLYGAKHFLASSFCVASVFFILTPGAAAWGDWQLVCGFRVIQGLAQGFLFPSSNMLLARWVPKEDRGTLVTFVYSGALLGTVLALSVSGLLSTSAAGWPSTFYVFGGLGLGWSLLWLALGSNSPAEDRLISVEERAYIEDSLRTSDKPSAGKSSPWRAILSSLPMWAIVIANCGNSLGFWILFDEMPTFIKAVVGFELKSNGLISALPYMSSFLMSFFFGWLSDFITNRNILTKTKSRKLFTAIGFLPPAVSLITLSYSRDQTLSIALLTTSLALNSAISVGYFVNKLDLTTNYAGTLMAISNSLGNTMAIIGPIVVGAVVTDNTSAEQWRIVFFIASGFYICAATFYILFGTAQLQWWNDHVSR